MINTPKLVHMNISDLHINVGTYTPDELAGNVLFKIIDKIKFRTDLDLVTLCGDTFHKPLNMKIDPYAEMINSFLEVLLKYARINGFIVVIIDGTKSHEQGMLKELEMIHTKRKDILEKNTTYIDGVSKISKNILDSLVYNGIENTKDMFNELLNNIEDVKTDEYPIVFVKDVTVLDINGVVVCCLAEQYTANYKTVIDKIPDDTDVLVCHGMLEGAVPLLDKLDEADKLIHRYNRSHIIKMEDILAKVRNYCVAGHIHNRVTLYNKDNKLVWYTGSTFSHNFSDAGVQKGFDEIKLMTDNSVRVTFHKTINDKEFIIEDITDKVNSEDVNNVIAYINKFAVAKRNTRFRVDVRLQDVTRPESYIQVINDNLPTNVSIKVVRKKVTEDEELQRRELADTVKNSNPLELISKLSNLNIERVKDILDE